MDMERHDFELDELIERIKSNDNRLVALQVPEGLKMQALDMMDAIEEETTAKIILAADPCYGACDLVHDKMQRMGVELVAHMGHSQMNIDSGMPTQFINVTYDGDPAIDPVLPILAQHQAIAEQRLAEAQSEQTIAPDEAARVVLPAVPMEASKAYCVAVYVLSTNIEIKATKATVAKAAAISSKIKATAKSHSDLPDHARTENKRFVEAIKIPDTNIALITPERIANNPPIKVKITVVIQPSPFE